MSRREQQWAKESTMWRRERCLEKSSKQKRAKQHRAEDDIVSIREHSSSVRRGLSPWTALPKGVALWKGRAAKKGNFSYDVDVNAWRSRIILRLTTKKVIGNFDGCRQFFSGGDIWDHCLGRHLLGMPLEQSDHSTHPPSTRLSTLKDSFQYVMLLFFML